MHGRHLFGEGDINMDQGTARPDRTIDVKFDEAQRFVGEHWTLFDDPSGVAADIDELWRAVSGPHPDDSTRTRLTLHRLRRSAGGAAPVAAVITAVREVLGPS
jgi:hypothetical protein